MKKTIHILTFLLVWPIQLMSQDSLEIEQIATFHYLKDSTGNQISWGCGWAGMPTKNIYLIRSLIYHRRFDLISQLLESPTPSTRYLSALALIRAQKKRYTSLDSATVSKINVIKQDTQTIYFCSGCTGHWYYSCRKLFDKKENLSVSRWTRKWIDGSFKHEY